MPQWSCEWQSCGEPAAQRIGDCLLCDTHLCHTHLQEPWHKCPQARDWESYAAQYAAAEARDIEKLRRQIDGSKLRSRASILRGNIPCVVELSRQNLSALMGNQNCHAEIVFQDGVKWLARFPLVKASSPPREVRDWILRSEAATLSYLRQHTSIPVPRIFDWACESDSGNPLRVGYILMEKLDGRLLDWQAATPAQREKVMQQLVDLSLEIEKHPFKTMGSLVFSSDGDEFDVCGSADRTTYVVGEGGGPLGPFSSPLEGSRAVLETYLNMMATGEIAPGRLDVYLSHRFRLDIADRLWPEEDPSGSQPFFLKHPDDKGNHILINDSFDITGIIDWQWTRTASRAEAFSSPCMMWPVDRFYEGSNELAADELRLSEIFRERGREDLANCVIDGRKVQRFFFALGPDCSALEPETFEHLVAGLWRAFGYEYEDWKQWRAKALVIGRDGAPYGRSQQLEQDNELGDVV